MSESETFQAKASPASIWGFSSRSIVDEHYFAERELFAARHDRPRLWDTIDHWPAYAGVGNFRRALTVIDAFRETLTVPGDIVEVGTWRGATLSLLAKTLLATTQAEEEPKRVHGFDSWAGFPAFGPKDNPETAAQFDRATANGQRFTGVYRELVDLIRLYELPVTLHRGRIEETIPAWVAATPGLHVSFVYLDVDLYEPTKTALAALHPVLSRGGVMLCDEYGLPDWPGETAAIDEFLAHHGHQYEMQAITRARQPTLKLTRRG